MIEKNLYINDSSSIDLYIVGYKSMGESIIINIDNQIVGVIDSYQNKTLFKTKDLIDTFGKKTLDFICWSHPDMDHTKGLSYLVDNYISKETLFLIPEGISAVEILSEIDYKKNVHHEFVKVLTSIREKIEDYNIVSVNHFSSIFRVNLIDIESDRNAELAIEAFSPISSLVRELGIKNYSNVLQDKNLYKENNVYSIGLSINLRLNGKITKIILNSDIEDNTIKKMNPNKTINIFNNANIFKIPHHSSKSTECLFVENILTNIQHACTTSYKRHGLPDKEILDKYCKISNGTIVSRTDLFEDEYGIIHYNIPILRHNIEDIKVTYDGAAGKYEIEKE